MIIRRSFCDAINEPSDILGSSEIFWMHCTKTGDWLQHMELPLTGGPIRLPIAPPSAAELALASARQFQYQPGGHVSLTPVFF
jgi:hypothetical protein